MPNPASAAKTKLARRARARCDAMTAAGILTSNDAVELRDGPLDEALPPR